MPRMRALHSGLAIVLGSLVGLPVLQRRAGLPVPSSSGGNGNGNGATTTVAGDAGNSGNGSGPGGSLLGGVEEAGAADSATAMLDGGFACVKNTSQYDIPGNGCDDDDDGIIDNVLICDSTLTATGTANDFMSAMGVCRVSADANHWGVVSASYTDGHSQTTAGTMSFDQQHGILSTFGSTLVPREGYMLGALSSGSATALDSDNGPINLGFAGEFKGEKNGMQGPSTATGNSGDVPTGFPQSSATCKVSSVVNDVIDLKVQIRVPTNAKGLSFDFNFMSGEWPDYVCSNFNDSFIAYLSSAAFNSGAPGNISFDTSGNPISVNNNFFQACTAGVQTGCDGNTTATSTCTLGPDQLAGTGFAAESPPQSYCGSGTSTSGGGTGWLTSQAPVQPGEVISLEFLIWDTGDESYDSSVLLDHLAWVPDPLPGRALITIPSPPRPPRRRLRSETAHRQSERPRTSFEVTGPLHECERARAQPALPPAEALAFTSTETLTFAFKLAAPSTAPLSGEVTQPTSFAAATGPPFTIPETLPCRSATVLPTPSAILAPRSPTPIATFRTSGRFFSSAAL